jgi:alpha-amylase
MVFADDGEKFGTWPQTKKHVYEDGWLKRFFELLRSNADWIQLLRLSDAVDQTKPCGKIYLPDASYREMTEWSLPVPRQIEFDQLVHQMEGNEHWPQVRSFIRGGIWRNFKVKYEEANEMYARMMYVSHLQSQAEHTRGSLRPASTYSAGSVTVPIGMEPLEVCICRTCDTRSTTN